MRIYYLIQGNLLNLDKIPYGEAPNAVNAVIEIPYGSNVKYEIDKDSGAVFVDRVMHCAMYYPANYGFIPNTLAGDNDPIDILVLNEYPLQAGSVIKSRIIGVLIMEDESGMDEKLLAVPADKVDPAYKDIKDHNDLPQITKDRIKHFFERYKDLEPNKWVKVKDFEGLEKATKLVQESIANYK